MHNFAPLPDPSFPRTGAEGTGRADLLRDTGRRGTVPSPDPGGRGGGGRSVAPPQCGVPRTRRRRLPIPHSGCAAPAPERCGESRPRRAPTGFLRADSAQAAPTDPPPHPQSPFLPPPPPKPTGIPAEKRGGCVAVGRSGRNLGWVGAPPPRNAAAPLCWGAWGARGVPVGAQRTPLRSLQPAGPIGVRRGGAAGWGHFRTRMGTPLAAHIVAAPHGHGRW